MSNTVKVTMNLTTHDVENAKKIRESLHTRSNAIAVSDALSVTATLIDLYKDNEILVRNKNGDLERLVFVNM